MSSTARSLDQPGAAFGPDDPAPAHNTSLEQVKKKSEGMSIFPRGPARGHRQRAWRSAPSSNMVNHETNELFFDNLEIPAENLIGEEGKGFKYILDGLNASAS